MLHVPFRYSDRGWFDRPRAAGGYDRRTVRSFRNREEAGHGEPWLAFLAGGDPAYPERILAAAQAQVRHRPARVEPHLGDDVAEAGIRLRQQTHPVVTEALVQLTWGGPQALHNGGRQQVRVRCHDAGARRAGLPPPVAALVSRIGPEATVADLVDSDPGTDRTVVVQAGAFGEHTIRTARHTACDDPSGLGGRYGYGHSVTRVTSASVRVGGPRLPVRLCRSTTVRLAPHLGLHTRPPSARTPFDAR
jgi:hypothetical protein